MKPETCPRCEDFADDARKVLNERCAPDERHCSCVPHLRAEVERLTAEIATVTARATVAEGYAQHLLAALNAVSGFRGMP